MLLESGRIRSERGISRCGPGGSDVRVVFGLMRVVGVLKDPGRASIAPSRMWFYHNQAHLIIMPHMSLTRDVDPGSAAASGRPTRDSRTSSGRRAADAAAAFSFDLLRATCGGLNASDHQFVIAARAHTPHRLYSGVRWWLDIRLDCGTRNAGGLQHTHKPHSLAHQLGDLHFVGYDYDSLDRW